MYQLWLLNKKVNRLFCEVIDSPYLLKNRINRIKRSKNLEIVDLYRRY